MVSIAILWYRGQKDTVNTLCVRDIREIGGDKSQRNRDHPLAMKGESFLNYGQHLPSESTGLGAAILDLM